jgi:Icc protein
MVKSPLIVAQITDTHLFAGVDQQLLGLPTNDSFRAVLDQLSQLQPRPDILLLTGDLSHDESSQSYERLQSLLTPLEIPTYWLPGNHDSLPVMQQVLGQAPVSPEKSFQAGGWHFLLLSTWVPGCVHGQLSPESLEWLDLQLQLIGHQPTLIGLHHPPCLVHSEWLDKIALQNSAEFFAVIDRYPQVKLIVFGHIHQTFDCDRQGVGYLGSPATCVQFAPASVKFSLDQAQPGFRLLTLFPDGTYETKIERVNYSDRPESVS